MPPVVEGNYFEGFDIGEEILTKGRTIARADVVNERVSKIYPVSKKKMSG